jgi:hypothetical protein
MRMVKSDIGDLNTSNLAKDWNSLQPAQRADMLNKINSIGSYFNRKGVGQYNPKGLLEKYHAWNAISNPDLTSFRNNAPLKVAFQISAAKMGAILGLPFGVSGSALGGGIGYLTALHYMRPESYIPILRELQPNLKSSESMNSDQALKLIKQLIASKK